MTSGTAWRIRAVIASLLIPPSVHLVSLNRLCGLLTRWSSRGTSSQAPPPDSIAWWVDRVLRALPWPWHHTCLKRAATLFYLLRRSGYPVELRVGVRREPGKELEAHAWLTLRGEPFLEPPSAGAPTFSPIATFG
ncbi:MAG TPA: lasso peptide biosynthesis B2 protein [Gemmatimonadaceae bacterium]|nr:lasso peptide biosynthesis B2 protein [Gemmatimonadaceae bacterium]